MLHWRSIFIIAILFAGLAHAESAKELRDRCSPVDLKSTLGPVRDQDNLDWCYAFTSADVLSQAMRQEGKKILGLSKDGFTKTDISPIQMAHESQRKNPKRNLIDSQAAGGDVAGTIKSALERGRLCSDEELNSIGGQNSPGLVKIQDRAMNEGSDDLSAEERRKLHKDISEDEIDRTCKRAAQELNVITVKDPTRSRYNQKKEKEADSAKTNKRMLEALDKALNSGRIAGISYDNFLQEATRHQAHASSVIARKIINGQCQYRIRNSWGLACKGYVAPYDKQCKQGEIWVSEKDLLPKIFSVDYIPPSKEKAGQWEKKAQDVKDSTYDEGTR